MTSENFTDKNNMINVNKTIKKICINKDTIQSF